MSLISVSIWAKGPYRIAVCGSSRYVEEIELALELDPRMFVSSCSDKKLDARLKVIGDQIELVESKVSWLRRNFSVKKLMVELARPKSKSTPANTSPASLREAPSPPVERAIAVQTRDIPRDEPVIELFETIEDDPYKVHWSLDTAATLDQWTAGLSTKPYPGFQIQTKVEVAPGWLLGDRFAFGASAFKIDDQIVWNQQVGNHLWASKQFELIKGLTLGPSLGYFFWGSFSGNNEITQFQKHDVSLGGRMIWFSSKRRFELECASSFLPVHLGVEGLIATRVYFSRNWYAALQGYGLGTWGQGQSGSFLSASLGLGYAQ